MQALYKKCLQYVNNNDKIKRFKKCIIRRWTGAKPLRSPLPLGDGWFTTGYITSVVVELIYMLKFIVKNVFDTSISDLVKLFKEETKKS